eukprot:SAG22_NODE_16242_length_330_cov_0.670996_1_plen_26_part_10
MPSCSQMGILLGLKIVIFGFIIKMII